MWGCYFHTLLWYFHTISTEITKSEMEYKRKMFLKIFNEYQILEIISRIINKHMEMSQFFKKYFIENIFYLFPWLLC